MSKIKELARELCDCPHKCKDTTDCVVEEEALLLINQDKSNNFEVKSNNLPFVLTNEDKVSVKVKQIEEMVDDIDTYIESVDVKQWYSDELDEGLAKALYNAGYRKQSEDMVSIKMVKKWLYSIAINNVGCVLDGDFSNACEDIISRLDGLKRYAKDMESEDKG